MLEVVEGDRCLSELLEVVRLVLEIMLCMLEAVESVHYVLEMLEDMCCVLLDLYAGGRGRHPLRAGAAGGCARSVRSA